MAAIEAEGDGVRIRVKAVPGASRDQVSGLLGDRVKVRVAAPPEGGKANKAIEALLARTLGVRAADVAVVAGHGQPEKVIFARGVSVEAASRALGLA